MHCGDDQVAALQLRILRQIGIALEFVVAPALATGIVGPLGGIRGRAIGAVELIAPDELEASGGRRLKHRAGAAAQREDGCRKKNGNKGKSACCKTRVRSEE